MIIVHEVEPGVFVRWPSRRPVYRTCDVETVIVRRLDGTETQEDRTCEPYEAEQKIPFDLPASLSDDELARLKMARVAPFEVPAGKRRVGEPSYRRKAKVVIEEYAVEDLPPPPSIEERTAQLIRDLGLKASDALPVITALAGAERK